LNGDIAMILGLDLSQCHHFKTWCVIGVCKDHPQLSPSYQHFEKS